MTTKTVEPSQITTGGLLNDCQGPTWQQHLPKVQINNQSMSQFSHTGLEQQASYLASNYEEGNFYNLHDRVPYQPLHTNTL
jgi:hypothetical protein